MPTKKLTQQEKDWICQAYQNKSVSRKTMANCMHTSQRSIYRVLKEAGLLTTLPRMDGPTVKAMKVLKDWGIEPSRLQNILELCEDLGHIKHTSGGSTQVVNLSMQTIMKHLTELDEDQFQEALTQVITARVAAKHNSSVANAMLQLQNKAQANVKPE